MARADLLVRRGRSRLWHQFGIGIRLGVAATLAVWLLWDLCIDTRVLNLHPARQARLMVSDCRLGEHLGWRRLNASASLAAYMVALSGMGS